MGPKDAVYQSLAVEAKQFRLFTMLRMDFWVLFVLFRFIVNRLFCLSMYKRHFERLHKMCEWIALCNGLSTCTCKR